MNLSFILPFYRKGDLFRQVCPLNPLYFEPGVEIVCVVDDPADEQPVLDVVAEHPSMQAVVIVNDTAHEWRPPCSAYNVGIRAASSEHVVLFDPESILRVPGPDYLRGLIAQDWRRVRGGLVWHLTDLAAGDSADLANEKILMVEATTAPTHWGIGFLLAPRFALETIGGFDESRKEYGLDDFDVRVRLSRLGLTTVIDPQIRAFHVYHPQENNRASTEQPASASVVLWQQKRTWGKEFSRVASHWNKGKTT